MQNIREWREGSITKATVVYEIPIDYSYGSDLHPIRNQLLWQTTKKDPFWSIMHGKQTNHLFYGLFWRKIFNGKCVLQQATLQYDTFVTKRRVKMKQDCLGPMQLFKPWHTIIITLLFQLSTVCEYHPNWSDFKMFSVNFQELDVDFRAKNKPEILPQCAISNTVLVLNKLMVYHMLK